MSSTLREARHLLRDRSFSLYLVSRLCSGTAMKALHATLLWQVYALTGDTLSVAVVGAAQFVPALVFGLVGGVVADAFDRRRIVQLAQAAATVGGVSLYLLSRETPSTAAVYGLAAFVAICNAFESPARIALLPQLVASDRFPTAVVVSSMVTTFSFMTGPVVAGMAIYAGGVSLAYAIYVGVVALSVVVLFGVRGTPSTTPRSTMSIASIREGIAFVWSNPIVLGCMTLDMFAVIFGGAVALLPVYAEDILGVGPRGYGILNAAADVGAVIMALVLLGRRPIRRAGGTLLWGVALFGLATIVFGLSRWFPLSLVAYASVGMADYLSVVLRITLIQLATPDAMRGRVSAVNMLFISSSNQLGAVESGVVAHFTSPTFAVVSGGIGAIIVVLLVAWRIPALRRHRR